MDKKSTIILIVSFVLLILWYPLVNHFYPPQPMDGTNAVSMVGTNGAANVATSGTNKAAAITANPPADAAIVAPKANAGALAPIVNKAGVQEQTVVLESKLARYTFTSVGGGLKLVELKEFPATITKATKKHTEITNQLASLNGRASLPALALTGGDYIVGDGVFTLTKSGNDTVLAEKALPGGLVVKKSFQLSSNYLVAASVVVENRSGQPLKLGELDWVIGTGTPMTLHDNGLQMGVQWYNGTKMEKQGQAWFDNRTLGCFPGTPRTDFVVGASNVFWGSAHNQYFAMVGIPQSPGYQFHAQRIPLPAPNLTELAEDPKALQSQVGYLASLRMPERILGANQSITNRMDLYAGPKEYNTLRNVGHRMELVMDFGGFFGWIAQLLLWSLNGLHSIGLNYGLAIISITVIIKLVFWPLTQASTRSMKRMAELQPQMKELQEKYKDDPKKMNLKLMEFMKENKVSPLGGCLPLLLQIPVFFGFYTMLQSAIELRGESFLWAFDLSQADTVFIIPGVNFPVNIFPILMAVSMIWQSRLTPPSPGMDPMQAKMMQYMPLMMVVFLYNYSAGLTLYWTVQNLLSILQMKLTKARDGSKPATPGRVVTPQRIGKGRK